jgi:hypothetical protein
MLFAKIISWQNFTENIHQHFFYNYFFFLFFAKDILAKNCHKEDFINFVPDAVGCIAINIHQEEELLNNIYKKNKLVFFIHGDQIEPKVSYFNKFASDFINPNALKLLIENK